MVTVVVKRENNEDFDQYKAFNVSTLNLLVLSLTGASTKRLFKFQKLKDESLRYMWVEIVVIVVVKRQINKSFA